MGETLGTHNLSFIEQLQEVDTLIIAGQAKSHCVAWTVSDLLDDIQATDPCTREESLSARRLHLAGGGAGRWITPTQRPNKAFVRFAEAGMNSVKSTDPMESWEGFPASLDNRG